MYLYLQSLSENTLNFSGSIHFKSSLVIWAKYKLHITSCPTPSAFGMYIESDLDSRVVLDYFGFMKKIYKGMIFCIHFHWSTLFQYSLPH